MPGVEVIANDNNLCGESPVWDWEKNQLYWTDSVGRKFYRYDWQTGQDVLFAEGFEINSCALNQSGDFVLANNSGVWLWDGTERLRRVTDHVDDHKCQINDCIADPAGRLIAGSCFYDPFHEYELGKLISVETDGGVRILDEGFHLANGLGFSPDNKILYFTDSVARYIFAYDYDTEEGSVHNRRVFVSVPSTEGLPDGLTVDGEGFVWSAQWYGKQVVRYDPNRGFFRGPLYCVNLGIQGKREFKTKFNLPFENEG